MTFDPGTLQDELIRDEGLKLKPYTDTTGHLTIGIGHNLEEGISEAAARFIFQEDIEKHEADLDERLSWWRGMSDARQRALLNMCFNMGVSKLMTKNPRMLAALQAGEYDEAADEALDGNWHVQVGERAQRIARMFREG